MITECALPSWASDCNGAINNAQTYITNTLPGRLDLVNGKIKEKSPSAKVIVLDYPKLFNGEDCNLFTWFSPSEETRLNETAEMLKNVISAAAIRAGSNFSEPTSESYHPKVIGHADGYYLFVHGVTG